MTKSSRYDFKSQGQRFVTWQLILLLAVVVAYLFAHAVFRPSDHLPYGTNFVSISTQGIVTPRDMMDLNWFIGPEQSRQILLTTSNANIRIQNNVDEINSLIQGTIDEGQRSEWQHLMEFKTSVTSGEYENARLILETIQRGVSPGTYSNIVWGNKGKPVFSLLKDRIDELCRVKREQKSEVEYLKPPLTSQCFWTTPCGSLFEVVFWSLFGVITYLLVNSAEYLRTGQFKPSERWVTYTKLVYGPILSLVLVLAIVYGYMDLGGYRVRVYTLPIVAFVFGYASRNIVTLFDKLVERFLGEAGRSIEAGPDAVAARRNAEIEQMMASAKPTTLQELKEQAKKIARPIVETSIIQKEASV